MPQHFRVRFRVNSATRQAYANLKESEFNRSSWSALRSPTGVVLPHRVVAKLLLRFPDEKMGCDRANTADLQTEREGD
ncbi:DUF4928 family protein, partial [Klebsiella pneumoniae]|uniref:DUF4928 family protein n=1 Tax=Klebsiella pneumoniae TaxID=573 RepID=UPI0015F2F8E0